jgi:Cu-Zn family superoxide dismutase
MNQNTIFKAVATFSPSSSTENMKNGISGVIHFEQSLKNNYTTIYGYINGLKTGKHGIHIHQYGDLTSGCESAGPHFNPFGKNHSSPKNPNRHVGDLGNIDCKSENSTTFFSLKDDLVSLIGPYSVIGRTLVIHQDEDDLGLTNHPLSLTTGNSGPRIACAIIGIAAPSTTI